MTQREKAVRSYVFIIPDKEVIQVILEFLKQFEEENVTNRN